MMNNLVITQAGLEEHADRMECNAVLTPVY
jgi:hypothetical protein